MIFFLLPILFLSFQVQAGDGSVKISNISTQEDTSVIIKKGAATCGPDYEVISGVDEVAGDPSMGVKESYSSWKAACEAWKKEVRELNKTNQVLSLNCSLPVQIRLSSGMNFYHSSATYKLRVQIRKGTD